MQAERQPQCLPECYVDGNKRSLKDIAHALVALEEKLGEIHSVKLKGHLSKIVWKNMMQIKADIPRQYETRRCDIDDLILLDRKIDMASLMVTPLTYESLLDEIFGISNGFMNVDSSVFNEDMGQRETVTFALNSNDTLYKKLRGLHVETIGKFLQEEATKVKGQYDEFRNKSHVASISEVHELVSNVPNLKRRYQSLSQHIALAESIKDFTKSSAFRNAWRNDREILTGILKSDFIVNQILRREPMAKVLRRLSLLCIAKNGFSESEMQHYHKLLFQTYGYEVIFSLKNLEAIGLMYERVGDPYAFQKSVDALNLVENNSDVSQTSSIAYATSGYAPLTVRLVEEIILHSTWSSISGILKEMPGPTVEISQAHTSSSSRASKRSQKTILVCIIGGATYLEVAALRNLASRTDHQIVLCTTDMYTGTTFVESLINRVSNRLASNASS